MRCLLINNKREMDLNYKTFGAGDPLVILHGLFGTLDNWQTLGRQFAEHYMVFLLDQRNHGRSPHTDDMNYPAMADDLHNFMESHWMYRAHIMGHSMGGKTAMELALHYPDMVDKLIVVDIAPKAYAGDHLPIFEALLSVDLDQIDSRADAEEQLKLHIANYAIRQFLLKNLTRTKEGQYRWKMNLPVLYQHYQEVLGATSGNDPFEGPTLFIRGANSSYILDEDFPLIRQLFPNARIKTIPGAGHWVHADQPEMLYQIVSDFLEEK